MREELHATSRDPALAWAQRVWRELELEGAPQLSTRGETAEAAWARSGALWLTGPRDGPPALPRVPLPSCMDGALAVLRALAPGADLDHVDGARLLGERAALAGLGRRGRVSPGGSCRLLAAADGWLAVSLPREDDLRALPAWLGVETPTGGEPPWSSVSQALARRRIEDTLDRARLLGLPVAPVAPVAPVRPVRDPPRWHHVADRGVPGPPQLHGPNTPFVIDFSSLWAGPLCAQLLQRCGARVVKVESRKRPDGARSGPAEFFDLLNAGKTSVVLDFGAHEGRAALYRLVAAADVVIEASRPRALEQLGLDAAAWIRARPGRVWLSLTAYGLGVAERSWVGFGDDVAAASGLAVCVAGAPLFVADAVADPLAGLHGAVATLAALQRGRSVRLDVSLRAVAAATVGLATPTLSASVEGADGAFFVVADGRRIPIEPPIARAARRRARSSGVDTAQVLASLTGLREAARQT